MTAKKFSMLFLIMSLALGMSSVRLVSASPVVSSLELLNTPWPTLTPVPYTPGVPTGTLSMGCGEGTPSGWGSVTPDPEWLLLCSSCVPEDTPIPSSVPWPTNTFVPTACSGTCTPGPTETITPTPVLITPTSQAFWIYCDHANTIGGSCVQDSNYQVHGTFSFEGDTSQPYNQIGAQAKLQILPPTRYTTLYISIYDASMQVVSYYGVDRLMDVFANPGGPDFQDITVPANGTGYWSDDGIQWFVYADASVEGNRPKSFYLYAIRSGSLGNYEGSGAFTIYVSSTGYVVLDDPITPTPSSGSYCASVNSSPPPSPFGYGDGEVVHNECAVFPGFDFGGAVLEALETWLPALSFIWDLIPDYEVQPITICVDFYNYTIVIFNVEIKAWKTILALIVFLSAVRLWMPFGGTGSTLSKPETETDYGTYDEHVPNGGWKGKDQD